MFYSIIVCKGAYLHNQRISSPYFSDYTWHFIFIVWPKSDLQGEIIKAYMVILHLHFFDNEKHAKAICALLPVTYEDIWWRLNKNNPKIKIRIYQLQDASSEICKKPKGCLVCIWCWRDCSEATPRIKNSVDFSNLKWDREFGKPVSRP